jgi:hypothetical protein
MKRFGIVLLVLLLVLCVCLLGPRLLRMVGADLGGFSGGSDYGGGSGGSSWGGGSDWGGGSSSWGSNDGYYFFFPIGSSDSGGSGGSGGMGNLMFYVILILILVIVFSRKNQHHATPNAGAAAGAQRTPDDKLTPLSEYEKLDPHFSAADMREKLSNVYVQMQNGCTARNIESLRPYFTDALYQQFDRQIKALIANRQINHVERISVLDVNLRGWFQEGNEDHLVAELKTRITDYTVNEDTGAVVSGSKTDEKYMTYEWDLSRPTGTTTEQAGETAERHCPNCGAPLSVNESAKCPYCDTVITFADHDWTIYAVKGIAQRTVQL